MRQLTTLGVAALVATQALPAAASPAAADTTNETLDASALLQLQLQPGIGNDWCTYNATSSVLDAAQSTATITQVVNTTMTRIGLNLWSPTGDRTGPVSLTSGEASDEFAGNNLAGTWEAHVGGLEAGAPDIVSLDVYYRTC